MNTSLKYLPEHDPPTKELLRDLVERYPFPTTLEEGQYLKNSLVAVEAGVASFIPMNDENEGLTYLPYPVLNSETLRNKEESLISDLAESIIQYVENTDDTTKNRGKAFEVCMGNTISFYGAYQTNSFTLGSLCRICGGTDDPSSPFNVNVEPWSSSKVGILPFFPCRIESGSKVTYADPSLLETLAPGYYHFADPSNPAIDGMGVYQAKEGPYERVIALYQFKDVYEEVDPKGYSVLASWRWGQQFFLSNQVPVPKEQSSNLVDMGIAQYLNNSQKIAIAHVLVSSNLLADAGKVAFFEEGAKNYLGTINELCRVNYLRKDEGLIDLEVMKQWFPTVAYNVQAAHKLKKNFTQLFSSIC